MGKTRIPRQQRAIATADAIIEAGFIAVADLGVANTTTRHIADIAGISVGSLYEYYANKEEIFAAMEARLIRDAVSIIQPLINDVVKMDVRDAVTTLLRRLEAFLLENNGRYLTYAQNALNVNPRLPLAPLTTLLQELFMRYLMQHPDYMRVPNIATMSYIMINGGIFIVLRHLSDPNPPVSFAELTDGLAGMVSHYSRNEVLLAAGKLS